MRIRILTILFILLFPSLAFGTIYNIGPGQTYTTFAKLFGGVTIQPDDIIDGGGSLFREFVTIPQPGTNGHQITFRNATIDASDLYDTDWFPYPGNLVSNPGFENWTDTLPYKWTTSVASGSTFTKGTGADCHSGNNCAKFIVDASNHSIALRADAGSVPCAPNVTYTFSFWHKIPVGKTANVLFQNNNNAHYLKSDSTWQTTKVYLAITGTGIWSQYSITFTMEAVGATLWVSFETNSSASSTMYFDDVMLTSNEAQNLNIWGHRTLVNYSYPYIYYNDTPAAAGKASVAELLADQDWYGGANTVWVYSATQTSPSSRWTVECTQRDYCVLNEKSYITFDTVRLTKGASFGIRQAKFASVTGCNFINSRADYNRGGALMFGNADGYQSDNGIIDNNYLYMNGQPYDHSYYQGIYLSKSSNNTISRNLIIDQLGGYAIQVQDLSNSNLIERNYSLHGSGVVTLAENLIGMANNNIVRNNIADSPTICGIFICGPATAATVNYAYNNTVANVPSGDSCQGIYTSPTNSSTLIARNNIVWGISNDKWVVYNANTTADDYDYNNFGPAAAGFIKKGTTEYATLADYVAATSQDTHSISSNPMFVGSANNFHIQPSSPCVGKGVNVSVFTDYDGTDYRRFWPFLPPIGAYTVKRSHNFGIGF